MAYTLEQIYTALGGIENGGAMAEDLQQLIKSTRDEAAKSRIEKNNILDKLNLRGSDNVEDSLKEITEALKALQGAGGDPRQLGVQIKTLQKQLKELTEKYEASEKRAKEEHDKSVHTAVRSEVLSALTRGKAIKPEEMYKILVGNIIIDENDKAFYKIGDDEVSLEDGVNQWLKDNPWAVKSEVQPGAGGGSGTKGAKKYTMEDLKNMSPEEINAHWSEISKGVEY